jgi:phosphonate metabolism protein (transferase hexapeptide repeat family)
MANSEFGRYVEIGKGSRIIHSTLGDYSYCDRYADIANAKIGKFANIASFTRIGPTDHPMQLASLHHFHYRSADYFEDIENNADFFAHRMSRVTTIGHDTWIGHGAIIRPEIKIGHGAVVASGAVVTKDVAPYTIVAGVAATEIKRRVPEHIAEQLMEMVWWNWSHELLKERLHDFRRLPAEAFIEKYG